MSEAINLICFKCKHFDPMEFGCKAFPGDDGIPQEILDSNRHDKPLPEQENSLVFELDPEKEKRMKEEQE